MIFVGQRTFHSDPRIYGTDVLMFFDNYLLLN